MKNLTNLILDTYKEANELELIDQFCNEMIDKLNFSNIETFSDLLLEVHEKGYSNNPLWIAILEKKHTKRFYKTHPDYVDPDKIQNTENKKDTEDKSKSDDNETKDKDENPPESDEEKRKKLLEQIENVEESYDNFIEGIDKAIKSQKETTNSLVGGALGKANFFCWLFIMKERNKNRIEFLDHLMKFIPDPEVKKHLDEQLKKTKEVFSNYEKEMKEALDKGEESAKKEDPKKLKSASDSVKDNTKSTDANKSNTKDSKSNKADDSKSIAGTVEYEKEHPDNSNENKIKQGEAKLKIIANGIAKKKQEILKADQKDRTDLSKQLNKIQQNYNKMKEAVEKLKKSTSESSDTIYWTISALYNLIENQLNNVEILL